MYSKKIVPAVKSTMRLPLYGTKNRFFSSQYPSTSIEKINNYSNENSSDFINKTATVLGLAALGSSLAYIFYKKNQPREKSIIANSIDSLNNQLDSPTDNSSNHGSLSSEIVSLCEKTYLKKGAMSKEKLIRELIVGTLLNGLDPHSQPATLLYQVKSNENTAEFFTLSEIKPNSMDFEDFITKHNWKEKLEKKPLKGFEVALAKVALIAGQQDCKFANMILTEYEDHYQAGVIDFEFTGTSFLSMNTHKATTDFAALINMIRDMQKPLDDGFGGTIGFHGTLVNDPRAKEFTEYVMKYSMNKEEIIKFYKTIAEADFVDSTIESLNNIREKSNLISRLDVFLWRNELNQWKKTAQGFILQHQATEIMGSDNPEILDSPHFKM